jgi:hypothetical protein
MTPHPGPSVFRVKIDGFAAGARLRFQTTVECETGRSERHRRKPDRLAGLHVQRFHYPAEFCRIFFAVHWIASTLTFRRRALLFVTE